MSAFDTARDLRLPGIVLESVYIDPTQLTTRMKNAVKGYLKAGYAEGGWSSKSKQLAQKLASTAGVTLISANGNGLYIPRHLKLTNEVTAEVMELVDAHETLSLISIRRDYDDNPKYIERAEEYCRNRHKEMRDSVKGKNPSRWLTVDNEDIRAQMGMAFMKCRNAEELEMVETICSMINNGVRIPIDLEY